MLSWKSTKSNTVKPRWADWQSALRPGTVSTEREQIMTTRRKTMNQGKSRLLFTINRLLIVLAVAAILAGLFFDQWRIVLINARILCLSCMGLE
jgi:hypothetical protein